MFFSLWWQPTTWPDEKQSKRMDNVFFSLRWRPTTWWGPANPPSLWRLSASLESSDMSSGRQFSIWAAPKMLLEFISINFFRNKDKIITNKQVSFPLVETTISHQERKHLDIAARLGTCWGQNIIQKITLKPLFLIWPPPGWSHAEDKIEPRQRGWGGCRYAQTHHCCQNIWEIDCWMYQHCHKRFASNNSRSWCPWLPVPGRCQELLPSTVWSHQMIWHGVPSCCGANDLSKCVTLHSLREIKKTNMEEWNLNQQKQR